MKASFIVLAIGLGVIPLSAQEKKELTTEIKRVTVYVSGAQIHREGKINLPSGKTSLRIKHLTPDMDPKSIQVKCEESVTILSVQHEWNNAAAAQNSHAIDSLNRIYKIQDAVTSQLKLRNEVLEKKLSVLEQNRDLGGQASHVSMDQLEQALKLFETTFMMAYQEKLKNTNQLDSIQRLQQQITEKITAIRGTPLTSKSEIEVLVMTDMPMETTVNLSYIVKRAGWIPRYDIRAKDITQPVDLVYKADVFQQTGEVWKNIRLTLSNASPHARQMAPELTTWRLTTAANTTLRRIGPAETVYGTRNITGCVRDVNGEPLIFANIAVAGRNLGTQTDLDGNFSLLLPQDANSVTASYTGYMSKTIPVTGNFLNIIMDESIELSSVVVTGFRAGAEKKSIGYATAGLSQMNQQQEQVIRIIDNQVSVEFELTEISTILSDGKYTNHELQTHSIDADYRYETTPKLDKGAYLIATLTDWEKYHIIEGEANLYFNNTYIGKTILDPVNLSDTLEISLGRDPEVLIERTKVDEFTKKTFLGTSTIVEKSIKLSFRNKKQYPIHLQISDQIPVSVNNAIMVTTNEISGGQQDITSGTVKWDLTIDPTSTRDLLMSYAVKYPSKERVILE